MVHTESPTVWRRWLAFELRRLREEAGLTQKDTSGQCGWSTSRLSFLENVQQGVTEDDLDKLLTLYDVPRDRWAPYLDAADRSRQKGWWQRYGERVVPEWLSLHVGLEQGASQIRAFEPLVVPGLLQTPDYAAAVLRSDMTPRTDKQIAELVELRTTRQEILTRNENPTELWVVLDEVALRRVGGDRPTMAAQLAHLAAMADRPNVTVQVLPIDHGVYSHTFGAFKVFGFQWVSDPGVVYLEHRDGALYLEESHEVEGHALVFQHLGVLALPPQDSLAMIRNLAEE
jgi:transcriptional regulator with XRE-family HTH domain